MTTTTVRKPATTDILVSLGLAVLFTGLSYFIGIHVHWISSLNWIEVTAVFTSYMATWLSNVERRANYPIGVVSSIFYAWLFADSHLVASTIVNIYLVFYLWFGYWYWRRDHAARPVSFVQPRTWPLYLLVTVAGYFAVYGVATAFGGTFLWTDSLILVMTILAQVLLDTKKWETWAIWLIMDLFATWEYFHTGLYLVGFQYILFIINTLIGAYLWWRSYRNGRPVGSTTESVRLDDGDASDEGAFATG